jgi:hypothetical protein
MDDIRSVTRCHALLCAEQEPRGAFVREVACIIPREVQPLHPSWTIHVKRDTQLSIAYSEELISSTISATLQSTDRHHGIVGQERCHFQLDS